MAAFLTTFLIAALTPIVLRWLLKPARQEPGAASSQSSFTMRPNRATRIIAWGTTAAMALLVSGMVLRTEERFRFFPAALGVMLFVPVVGFLNTLRRRIHVSDEGLLVQSPWTGTRHLPWADICELRFREWGQTIRVRGKDSRWSAIPVSMTGLDDLERVMCKHLPTSTVAPAFTEYRMYLAGL
jgi:hypothetical protein